MGFHASQHDFLCQFVLVETYSVDIFPDLDLAPGLIIVDDSFRSVPLGTFHPNVVHLKS